jgi:hypothetical protein
MGGSGTDGDILLYPSDEDIAAFEKVVFATIRVDAEDATLRLGKIGERGKPGKILLRGGDLSGGTRIRLDASSADLRMGGSGADGDIMLFTADADSDSAATEASIHLNAGGGQAWGGGTIALRGGSPQNNRIVLNAIAANIVVGGNGQHGDLYVFPGTADHAPVTQATIHLDGQTGDVSATSFTAGGIQLDVPDYVWDSNYALMPIEELRAYTAREKRLPNMPSAAEIKREGLNLSQFQMQLLEKIEELTRYLLMQQETIEAQQAQIDALGSELQGLTHGQR